MAVKPFQAARKLWQTMSSIKTGVILLIIVVIVAASGTIILQRPITEPDEMQRAYSPHVLRMLDAVGLTDVYHAWWFVLLLLLVSCSIIAASIQRFPNSWRYFARPGAMRWRRPGKLFGWQSQALVVEAGGYRKRSRNSAQGNCRK